MGRLSDALKALFGSNKTTGTYVPLVTSNGTPDGNMSMENLGSVMGGLGINTPTFSTHQDIRTRREKLYSAIAKAGVQVVTARETDVLTFGNSQLFVYRDADGSEHIKLRMFRDNEWSGLLQIVGGNFKTFEVTNASISSPAEIANEVLTYVRQNYTDPKVLFYGIVTAQAGSRFVYGMLYSSNYNYGTINVEMYNGTKAFYKVQNGEIALVS